MGEKNINSLQLPGIVDKLKFVKPDGVIDNAQQLLSNTHLLDSVPYNFRTAGGSLDIGDREELEIVGVSVGWNQLYDGSYPSTRTSVGVTFTVNANGTITLSGANDGTGASYFQLTPKKSFGNHVMLLTGCPSGGGANTYRQYLDGHSTDTYDTGNGTVFKQTFQDKAFYIRIDASYTTPISVTFKPQIVDLTLCFGPTIADYVYSLEQATAGSGVAWLKHYFPKMFGGEYHAYVAHSIESVSGLSAHVMRGFNQWDEEWEVGLISSSTGENVSGNQNIRAKNFCKCLPNTSYYVRIPSPNTIRVYWYDADKNFIEAPTAGGSKTYTTPSNCHYFRFVIWNTEYGTTYNHDICINFHYDGERDGTYEPYISHSYALDDTITLRGMLKLDSNNVPYADGSVYHPDGTVEDRWGEVEITSPMVTLVASPAYSNIQYARISKPDDSADKGKATTNMMHPRFVKSDITTGWDSADNVNKVFGGASYAEYWFGFPSGTTVEQARSALAGTVLLYSLATPTTSSATPYQAVQAVDNWGTEEFVSTGIVPVGHNTKYPPDLKAKLEMLPSSPDGDGDYIMRQSGGENAFVALTKELPPVPTEDGTYALKVTVSGGVATKSWESES